jgi:hypothetical protein
MPDTQTAMSFASWDDFLVTYDAAHRHPANRWVHHLTHVGVVAGALAIVAGRPLAGALPILVAFPLNWSAHLLFDRNTPAFFAVREGGGVAGAGRQALVAVGGLAWTGATAWRACRRLIGER